MTNNDPNSEGTDEDERIFTYRRAQALEDKALVDVSEMALEAGIRCPTAISHEVWSRYVALSEAARRAGQYENGRLWDVLWMFACAASTQPEADELYFRLYVSTDCVEPRLIELKAAIGPGDSGEPVLTIMLPDED